MDTCISTRLTRGEALGFVQRKVGGNDQEITDLDVPQDVILDGCKRHGTHYVCKEASSAAIEAVANRIGPTEHRGEGFGRLEEGIGGDGIVLLRVDGHVDEGPLEGVDKRAARRNRRGHHLFGSNLLWNGRVERGRDEKQSGQGMRFVVWLPLAPQPREAPQTSCGVWQLAAAAHTKRG